MYYLLLNIASIILGIGLVILMVIIIRNHIFHRKNMERSLNMVFLQVKISSKESKSDREEEQGSGAKDFKEAVAVMAQFYDSVHSIYSGNFKNKFIGEDFLSLEYVALDDQIYFYFVVPNYLSGLLEKQITGFYPDAYVEKVEEFNIFQNNSQVAAKALTLGKHFMHPIRTYEQLSSDPINNLTNALNKLSINEGAVVQIMIRPADKWQKKGKEEAKNLANQKEKKKFTLNPIKLLGAFFNMLISGGGSGSDSKALDKATPMAEEELKELDKKNSSKGFEAMVRVIVAADVERDAKAHLNNIISSFAQYDNEAGNKLSGVKYYPERRIIEDYIFRSFRYPIYQWLQRKKAIFSSDELASLYHLPSTRYNKTPGIKWQNFKYAPAPKNMPQEGLLLGHNQYRGVTTEVRMSAKDRFRHFYVIGQTGTGKSSIFQIMLRQDLREGRGVTVVDPHGELIETIMPFIPRERADDVVYFNPADQARPMGLNILEADTDDEKELVALDAMNIMIKLFGNEIFGPRIQDYFRNGCLTLMAHPEGGTLTDIVRLFTDDAFQQEKVKHIKNPVVRSFWEDQMAKTGMREKQEIIPYFAAKFGQFITNSMMRNIIGQLRSAFDFIDVMQNKKILLMNLSKGEVGDINSKLLGLIIVSKLQMAALRRQRFAAEDRVDHFMYIDEFQNYITDSIESILSEARKYRLSLNMAHQYIAQLEGEEGYSGKSKVKDAVFGNVGTMMCYKIGAQDAEYMAKEMSPTFTEQDLINVDTFKGCMKLSIDGQPSKPFSITVPFPWLEKGDQEVGEALKQLSRLKYGRDREFVEREITRRIGIIE